MDMKLEVVVVPVADVQRAKHFYKHWGSGKTSTTSPAPTSVWRN